MISFVGLSVVLLVVAGAPIHVSLPAGAISYLADPLATHDNGASNKNEENPLFSLPWLGKGRGKREQYYHHEILGKTNKETIEDSEQCDETRVRRRKALLSLHYYLKDSLWELGTTTNDDERRRAEVWVVYLVGRLALSTIPVLPDDEKLQNCIDA